MQKRKPASSIYGRPSGTDGSDFKHRMLVDSRYKRVAQGKSRLSTLFFIQAVIHLVGVLYPLLSTSEEESPITLAVTLNIIALASLLIGELGRRRSQVVLLKIYVLASSIAILVSIIYVTRNNLLSEVIRDPSSWETRKFQLELFHVVLGFLVQIITSGTVVSLTNNMSPPKRVQ